VALDEFAGTNISAINPVGRIDEQEQDFVVEMINEGSSK
jgi:hypothetical protein